MEGEILACRPGCGACCIALSISSPMPGLPGGKPAGVRCIHLADDLRCSIYGTPGRPPVCGSLKPLREMCGSSREEALAYLEQLEALTAPDRSEPVPAVSS
ncbi:YkgJ family cysteine cluster protein [Breznakiella homolactica]|uniref:YkgJ family cysteine cluster protein n=1 Tax=Breznakiella homolactica TaxID=2798577 RepID=A0A7T8B8I7_9SPIR|nr:YkgJ family cysteine cluster protein [Breznakiella homolactica]QQO08644.1 YkgJ family cysteine cluster protein [Breznakiella homolactica]